MSDSFVTQCPHCQTSFRVSHAQLGMARGVVRCGACLQVFNAAQQLLNQSTETGQPPAVEMPVVAAPEVIEPAPVEVPAPTVPVNPAPWQTSTIDLDHLDLDEELAKLEEREIQPSKSFGQPHKPKTTSLSARRETSDAEEGEWSDSLFSESAADRAESAKVAGQAAEIAQTGRTEPSLSLDLDEPDDTPPLQLSLDDDLEPPLTGERLSATEDEDDARPEPAPVSKDRRKRNEPAMGEDPLMDLVDDPLQLDWQKRRTPWGKRLLWSLLVLLAAAALAGQYIANHFDELARQDQYRPIFQQLCPQIGCTVPSKVDINRIKSSNLVVLS
ncbi:MAG: zinc-ribbon domain-containing protein, partial [Pseudomonas sp.]|nr:zinc-ribbon domain-containing protein [Pseudomonas sp.]